MRIAIAFSFAICTLAVGCVSNSLSPTPATTATERVSPEAREYLSIALDILQENHLYRDEIDWEDLSEQAFGRMLDARIPSHTYPAIELAIRLLGDHHSYFLTPEEASNKYDPTARPGLEPQTAVIEGKIGMIVLPSVGGAGSAAHAYPPLYQNAIRELAESDPCAWIVDLRQNGGGNMFPMLAGIGPILGEGQVGAFVLPDGRREYWYYIDGEARWDEEVLSKVENPYELEDSMPLVAVLTGQTTGSSGEAVVIAFRGRPNTRSFGEKTSGLPTGIEWFTLSDGAVIGLAMVTFADREGHEYSERIIPDEIVYEDPSGNTDRPLEAATKWILSQPVCTG